MTRTSSLIRSSSESSSTRAALTRSVTAGTVLGLDKFTGNQFLGDFAGQIAHIFFGKKHVWIEFLRETKSLCEPKSVTHAVRTRSPEASAEALLLSVAIGNLAKA